MQEGRRGHTALPVPLFAPRNETKAYFVAGPDEVIGVGIGVGLRIYPVGRLLADRGPRTIAKLVWFLKPDAVAVDSLPLEAEGRSLFATE